MGRIVGFAWRWIICLNQLQLNLQVVKCMHCVFLMPSPILINLFLDSYRYIYISLQENHTYIHRVFYIFPQFNNLSAGTQIRDAKYCEFPYGPKSEEKTLKVRSPPNIPLEMCMFHSIFADFTNPKFERRKSRRFCFCSSLFRLAKTNDLCLKLHLASNVDEFFYVNGLKEKWQQRTSRLKLLTEEMEDESWLKKSLFASMYGILYLHLVSGIFTYIYHEIKWTKCR